MITGKPGAWYVRSRKGKNLGGPYNSKSAVRKRLRQVEFFKHGGKTLLKKGLK